MSAITNLVISNLKKNRTRSILILLTVILTTGMLTMIAGDGYAVVRLNQVNAKDWYGSYYGSYRNVTEETLREMRLHSEFSEIGTESLYGTVLSEAELYLAYMDETAVDMTGIAGLLTEGRLPERGNEIAAQPSFFAAAGVPDAKIGDTVEIPYRKDLKSQFERADFVICGLFGEPEEVSMGMEAYTSCEFFAQAVPKEEQVYTAYFRMPKELGVNYRNGEAVMKELAVECGISEMQVRDNPGYLMWGIAPDKGTVAGCVAIAAVVMLFSVIVIYNIFQVSIAERVQDYGKIKAIGATKKQMKQIVWREGMLLAAAGIPAGILLGLAAAWAAFGRIAAFMQKGGRQVLTDEVSVFCLPLLLVVAGASLLTVWAAARKPMRVAAEISPVEAIRYQEEKKPRKGSRKKERTPGVMGLCLANMAQHRKRMISTMVSMGLSCVLFVVLINLLENMDLVYEATRTVSYGQFAIALDYSLEDEAYPENNLDSILKSNPLNQELEQKILSIPGTSVVGREHMLYAKIAENAERGSGMAYDVCVLGPELFQREKEEYPYDGVVDYDSASAENQVLYGYKYGIEEDGFSIGDELSLCLYDGVGEKNWQTKIAGAFGFAKANFVMTEQTFRELGLSESAVHTIWVDCPKEDAARVQTALEELLAGKEYVKLRSYQDTYQNFKDSVRMMKGIGYVLCLVIAFISFMNMANTMITNAITRKREFGVLQAVGMTNKQLNWSLWMEGIVLTAGTVLVALAAGMPIGYALFSYGKSTGIIGLHSYHIPGFAIMLMALLLTGLQTVLSFLLSRNVKKESLVERIRYQQ